ncbi:MAG: hypothetical protein V3U36_00555 [Anaerolineales bacterium]
MSLIWHPYPGKYMLGYIFVCSFPLTIHIPETKIQVGIVLGKFRDPSLAKFTLRVMKGSLSTAFIGELLYENKQLQIDLVTY